MSASHPYRQPPDSPKRERVVVFVFRRAQVAWLALAAFFYLTALFLCRHDDWASYLMLSAFVLFVVASFRARRTDGATIFRFADIEESRQGDAAPETVEDPRIRTRVIAPATVERENDTEEAARDTRSPATSPRTRGA